MGRRVILDTSSYQGNVDFVALKARFPELAGAIVKATEGGWEFTNPNYDHQMQSAIAAFGGAVGNYCFVHPAQPPAYEAGLFLDRIKGYSPKLGVWLDCEVSDGVPAAQMLPRLLTEANIIAAHYPMKTGFYTAPWWWDPNTVGSIAAHMETWPLWLAGYTQSLPPSPVPWTHPLFWQFTDNYMGTGIDASVFLGTDAQWSWLTGASPAPAPGPSVRIMAIQHAVHGVADGVFGPDTDHRCEAVRTMRLGPGATGNKQLVRYLQQVMAFTGASADGIWGPITASHWIQTVTLIQAALGVTVDGNWGAGTDAAYLALNPLR